MPSRYCVYALGQADNITTPSEEYYELGSTIEECQAEFRDMLDESWTRFLDAKSWEHLDDDEEVLVAKGRVDLKKLLAISDHIDELLAKGGKKGQERPPDSDGGQPPLPCEDSQKAMETVRARMRQTKQAIVGREGFPRAKGLSLPGAVGGLKERIKSATRERPWTLSTSAISRSGQYLFQGRENERLSPPKPFHGRLALHPQPVLGRRVVHL